MTNVVLNLACLWFHETYSELPKLKKYLSYGLAVCGKLNILNVEPWC